MSITTELDTLKDSVLEFKEHLKNSDDQPFEVRAVLGDADSQYKMYEVAETSEEKIKWLKLSAENGNEKYYHYLGYEYSKVDDYKNSRKYYEKAIEVKPANKYSKPNLALTYVQLKAFRDLEKAEKILEEAREENDFYFIDHCYGALNFFKEDYEKSVEFFEKDIISGSLLKENYKNRMLLKGYGYEQDIVKAVAVIVQNKQWFISKEFFKAVEELNI